MRKLLLLISTTLLLSACGGDDLSTPGASSGSTSSNSTSSSSSSSSSGASGSSSTSSSSASSSSTSGAAALFQTKGCNACHANGIQLVNLTSLVENNTLVAKIANDMPPGNVGSCVGSCAQTLATYLETEYYQPSVGEELQKANMPVESYLRKAKALVTGSVVTEQELASVKANPNAMAGLIRNWQSMPGYFEKMEWFLEENIQFARNIGPSEYVGQLRGGNKANPPTKYVNPKIYENGYDSAIKTIMDLIVKPDKPFNSIATQTEWMVTPALMSLLLAFDHPNDAALLDFKIGVNLTDAEKNYSMTQKINTRRFYFPPPAGQNGFRQQNGSISQLVDRKEIAFVWGALNQFSNETSGGSEYKLFRDSDYTTWKKVKIARATSANPRLRFWDLPAIRDADTLYLNVERVGFFTHPNFFGRWETNDDNQWRVTINQTLITALNQSFAPDDLSITLNEDVISPEHAAPGTDCYGCHRLVDPMRNYFRNRFDDSYGKPRNTIQKAAASFSFNGETETGNELMDLGRALATHPAFAPGWVQKLCFYANAQNCVESDPEFVRVAEAFKDSNFNFNELIVTFFSSDLIKKDVEEKSERAQPAYGSISRYQHVCQILSRRFSDLAGTAQNPCREGARSVSTLSETIPQDEWTRGALAPATPTRPDMFSYTTMENMCQNIALNHYGKSTFPVSGINGFLDDYLLPSVLSVPKGDSNRAAIRSVLMGHYNALKNNMNTDEKTRLISVFTLGCASPLLSSVDF